MDAFDSATAVAHFALQQLGERVRSDAFPLENARVEGKA